MKRTLQIFTFQNGYMGGVATMVKSYLDGVTLFNKNGYIINDLNISPSISTGITKIDNVIYIFTQRYKIRKYLKNNIYDIIHIHTSREFLFLKDLLLAKMIKRLFQIPVVITIHVGDVKTVYNRINWFEKYSINILNNYVDKTIFLSEVMRNNFLEMKLLPSKTTVLYNFHNFTPIDNIPKNNKEEDLQLKLLYVGAIHREKGIIELLSALSKLPDLNYHLNICGELTDPTIKEDIHHYKNSLGHKVSFLGYVSGGKKTQIFESADILILPSYHEGLPLVIMEALGAGCAIITTKVGAIPEILSENNCFWIDIASKDSIVEILSNISPERIDLMKKKNKDLGNIFTLSKHIKSLCEIYNQ